MIGGGRVAGRRIRRLLASGARVRLLPPDLTYGLRLLAEAGRFTCSARDFEESDLDGA